MTRNIKGIFFDAAGVFYYRPEPTELYALKLLGQLGLSAALSERDRDLLESLRSRANRGSVDHEMYWDQFLSMRGVTQLEQRQGLIQQILEYSNNVLPVAGGREALAGLKQRGFILGLVTDTMYPVEWKVRRLEKVGVAEFIDVIACSTAIGVHKPVPAAYLNALEQAHLTPSESAFVGHEPAELEGAHRTGIATVAVNCGPGTQADYYAESLIDLLKVPILQKPGGTHESGH